MFEFFGILGLKLIFDPQDGSRVFFVIFKKLDFETRFCNNFCESYCIHHVTQIIESADQSSFEWVQVTSHAKMNEFRRVRED